MPDNKPIIIVLGIVVLAIVGLVAFFMMSSDEAEPLAQREIAIPSPPPEPVPEPDPVVVVEEEPEPLAEQEPPRFTLPQLDDSDQLIRDGVVSLTRHEGINAWLAPNELIRKFVAAIDNVGRGQVAKETARFLAPMIWTKSSSGWRTVDLMAPNWRGMRCWMGGSMSMRR